MASAMSTRPVTERVPARSRTTSFSADVNSYWDAVGSLLGSLMGNRTSLGVRSHAIGNAATLSPSRRQRAAAVTASVESTPEQAATAPRSTRGACSSRR